MYYLLLFLYSYVDVTLVRLSYISDDALFALLY